MERWKIGILHKGSVLCLQQRCREEQQDKNMLCASHSLSTLFLMLLSVDAEAKQSN